MLNIQISHNGVDDQDMRFRSIITEHITSDNRTIKELTLKIEDDKTFDDEVSSAYIP